jgi:hypothetical protein
MPNAFKKAFNWFRKPNKSYKEIAQTPRENDRLESTLSSSSDDSLVEVNEEKIKFNKTNLIKKEDIKTTHNKDELISYLLPKMKNLSFIRLSDYSKANDENLFKIQNYLNPLNQQQEDYLNLEQMLGEYCENNQEKEELLRSATNNVISKNLKKVIVKRLPLGDSLM